MKTKTFKIGEYCRGGIITVEIRGNNVAIIGKDWDMSQGTRKGSNQKNAKEWTRFELSATDNRFSWGASEFLNDLTTSYHADQVLQYIQDNVAATTAMHW